jgi:hypothetical protein
MKKLVMFGVAGAALLAAPFAYAGDTAGAIKEINLPNHTVTLDDGKKYVFTAAIDLSKFKVGDKVKINFSDATPVFAAIGINGSGNSIAMGG